MDAVRARRVGLAVVVIGGLAVAMFLLQTPVDVPEEGGATPAADNGISTANDPAAQPISSDNRQSPARLVPTETVPETASATPGQPEQRVVDAATVWDGLYRASEQSMLGAMNADSVLALTTDIVSLLGAEPQADGEAVNGITTYTLLDDPNNGTVKLFVNKDTAEKVAEYSISAKLNTRPGYFTGYPEDRADQTKLDIVFDLDAAGKPKNLALLTQVRFHHDPQLFELLASRGEPTPIGASITVGTEKTTWQQTTLAVSKKSDGTPLWTSAFGERVSLDGSLNDQRTNSIASVLQSARR